MVASFGAQPPEPGRLREHRNGGLDRGERVDPGHDPARDPA
jgi:hypothetical protein